ncbi:methionyl-tRNA formyltransferase [Pedobacter flavus]|uniref:Formyltransferase family protein n=1 Tax=Pedobacter flavus TaxID=3113906 RepID=A0ABU7H045_9SPHI|nr:formyltransferase family protein [Pedobacter sp. VNH31]MEE1884704.1 formyltransferase family protein [Pedobacter sp. VNH31]
MRVAIIGRSELIYNSAICLLEAGFHIPLIITSKEAPEYAIKSKDFEDLANRIGAKFIYAPKITEEVINQVKSLPAIDVSVSINYSGIISQEVIDLFPLGILNAHGGDLPRYRGNACQAWAIINGEKQIGLCIHKMIGGELDSGPIIEREYLPIDINTKIGMVFDWMVTRIPVLMLSSLQKLRADKKYVLEHQSLDPKVALRCYSRRPEDGFINWNLPNIDILRLINASSRPYSGAYTYLNNLKITVWEAEIFQDDEVFCGIPGQITAFSHNEKTVTVLCGTGKLKLSVLNWEDNGKKFEDVFKSVRARFFLNSFSALTF